MIQSPDTASNLKDVEMRVLNDRAEEEAGVSYITIHPTAQASPLVHQSVWFPHLLIRFKIEFDP